MRRLRAWLAILMRRPLRLAILLAVATALACAAPHLLAWYHLRAGRAAVQRYHTPQARAHLDACLKTWPGCVEAHCLAARAARRAGADDEAEDHIRACQRLLGGVTPETTFEWSLLRAATGRLDEVEDHLLPQIRAEPARAALVLEALAEGYLRMSRPPDAQAYLDRWLAADPDNVQAHFLYGNLHRQGHALTRAVHEYRRALELDASRDDARWQLGVCLQEIGRQDEARACFEELRPRRGDDPDLLARLALSYHNQGRDAEARVLLEAVLAAHPEHALALRTRGDVELTEGKAEAARQWLDRAAAANPYDHRTQFLLGQCFQRMGDETEARRHRIRSEKLKEQAERLSEIANRQMPARPNDPELHCEMGRLLIALGRRDAAERWLLSALRLDPNHQSAHAALADCYAAAGETQKAEYHRSKAAAAALSGASPPRSGSATK
jgi:tetratricopeptide (TPR) repeat protein